MAQMTWLCVGALAGGFFQMIVPAWALTREGWRPRFDLRSSHQVRAIVKLMGPTVLESGIPIQSGLHLYAHCLRGTAGGVALLAINNDRAAARVVTVPMPGERYTLASDELQAKVVRLNGVALELDADDALPGLTGTPVQAGDMSLGPATITFIALPGARNQACL